MTVWYLKCFSGTGRVSRAGTRYPAPPQPRDYSTYQPFCSDSARQPPASDCKFCLEKFPSHKQDASPKSSGFEIHCDQQIFLQKLPPWVSKRETRSIHTHRRHRNTLSKCWKRLREQHTAKHLQLLANISQVRKENLKVLRRVAIYSRAEATAPCYTPSLTRWQHPRRSLPFPT